MNKLPLLYEPVKFRQVFIPSFSMLLIALLILLVAGYRLSLFGTIGLWAIPFAVIGAIVTYSVIFWLTSRSWFNTIEMRRLYSLLTNLFKNLTWLQIVLLSISAGVGEELLFRGLLQTWLISVTNPWWGIVAASLVFGLMHYLNAAYILLTFLLGGLFGIVYYFTDSLVLVMLAHTVYDIIAFGIIVKFPYLLKTEQPPGGFDA